MPYTIHQGLRIHYQIVGEGPPLVLHHGFAGSLEAWRQFGYVPALEHTCRFILLDARGHGASDKPRDPAAYAVPRRVADVVAVLDALRVRNAHFFGYSMGGWIGFGMARHAPERVRSFVLGGAHPYRDSSWDAFRQVDGTDPEAFIAALEAVLGERIPPEVKPLIVANDLRALAAAAQERPSLEEVLQVMTMPCMLFVGEADPRLPAVRECAQHIRAPSSRSRG